jgi:hypothetical protein
MFLVQPKLLGAKTLSKPNRVKGLPVVIGFPAPRCYQRVTLMSQWKRWSLVIPLARLVWQGVRLPPP